MWLRSSSEIKEFPSIILGMLRKMNHYVMGLHCRNSASFARSFSKKKKINK